jgi:hypothetical protein
MISVFFQMVSSACLTALIHRSSQVDLSSSQKETSCGAVAEAKHVWVGGAAAGNQQKIAEVQINYQFV